MAGFGDVIRVEPTGRHQATIVWLHDVNEDSQASKFVKNFSLDNVRWICPTAPLISGGSRSWFEVSRIGQSFSIDLPGLNTSAEYVAKLLENEPENVTIGVAGYGVGGALALHMATCYVTGHDPFKRRPINLGAVVAINAWLPNRINLGGIIESIVGAETRAGELPILLTRGSGDQVVPPRIGIETASVLRLAGFEKMKEKVIESRGHEIEFQTMTEASLWLTKKLALEGEEE